LEDDDMTKSKKNLADAPTKPEDIHRQFAEAVTSAKIDAVLALYERDATLFVPPSGPAVTGLPAIRESL
jgi:ketosteroid isomerase-like protein